MNATITSATIALARKLEHGPGVAATGDVEDAGVPLFCGISIGGARYHGWEYKKHRLETCYWRVRKTVRGLQPALKRISLSWKY